MEIIYEELLEQKDVRSNLSTLRAGLKGVEEPDSFRAQVANFVEENEELFLGFLACEDAKTRKNAALLLGDLAYSNAADALYEAYENEKTLFVRSSYLEALAQMDVRERLPKLKDKLAYLLRQEISEENGKHIQEEIRALRNIIIGYEGIAAHTFRIRQDNNRVLLTTNYSCREVVQRQTGGKVHPLGVMVQTKDLLSLLQVRTYRRMLFPIPVQQLLEADAGKAAEEVWYPMLSLCRKYHKEPGPFYFRVECKAAYTLEQRSEFTKKLGTRLEQLSQGELINSTSDYEIELRLIANREGRFFPCLSFSTLPDQRFAYRKHAISASIHPATAALIMEIARPYLKENAQIMDPFCGVGTMLVERDIAVPAREKYGTDIFGDAIDAARENAAAAGEKINFIHRDFFDFRHDYKFDEIITNMPVSGRMTRGEMDTLYEKFFQKALTILQKEAVMILYTKELGFVKKQLRLHREFKLLQEICMQKNKGFYLLIIGVKR